MKNSDLDDWQVAQREAVVAAVREGLMVEVEHINYCV